jgi:thioredoxin-like negative regulator of GroEL
MLCKHEVLYLINAILRLIRFEDFVLGQEPNRAGRRELRRLTDPGTLSALIAESHEPVVVLVDICRVGNTRLRHQVKSAVAISGVHCRLVWVDPATVPLFASLHDACMMPTLLLFIEGRVVDRMLGGAGVDALTNWILTNTPASRAPSPKPNVLARLATVLSLRSRARRRIS